jgi:DNA-binding SARP family transcriptional activator
MNQSVATMASIGPGGREHEARAYHVQLLGEFAIRTGDASLVAVPPSTWRLLALVALERRWWGRRRVCEVLWPDTEDIPARGNLRTLLWRLGRIVPGLLEATSVGLRLTPNAEVDVHQVSWVSFDATAVPHPELVDPALFVQELLPGWTDDFLDLYRENLRQQGLHSLEALARRLLEQGNPCRALAAGLTAVQAAPLRESARRIVMEIHLAEGNFADADREFRLFARILRQELQVTPSPLIERLVSSTHGHPPSPR